MSRLVQIASILFLTLSFWTPRIYGALAIPSNLNKGDEETLLQIIGVGTSFRMIDDPFPLGGFEGIEMGVSYESVPTEDVGKLGSRSNTEKSLTFSRVTLGKGLFNNVDLFVSFFPYNEATGLGIYGGAVRWAFFQATFLPVTFTLLGHGSSTNINNLVFTQNTGFNLLMTLNLKPFAFYTGGGIVYSQGQFAKTITADGMSNSQVGQSIHSLFGLSVQLGEFFMAGELDIYNITVVSAKGGLRF